LVGPSLIKILAIPGLSTSWTTRKKSLDDDGLEKKQSLSVNRPEPLVPGPEPNQVGKTSPTAERGLRVLAGLSVEPISGCNTGFIGFMLALFLL
jgi:hypothetical protein